jgi:hypothetical protein
LQSEGFWQPWTERDQFFAAGNGAEAASMGVTFPSVEQAATASNRTAAAMRIEHSGDQCRYSGIMNSGQAGLWTRTQLATRADAAYLE